MIGALCRAVPFVALAWSAAVAWADEKTPPAPAKAEPVTRLFVQDLKSGSLKWADVRAGADGKLALDPLAAVDGFPKLDPAKQKLVQMREAGSLVCVGVRDDDEGKVGSGWVLVQSGVGYTDHGDHGHWSFKKKPATVDSRVDKQQGNPAHVYLYDGRFFLAHDGLGGYTRIDPAKYATNAARALGKDAPRFLVGGGGHITLAVVEDKVGYACWIDADGPNKGRVDVTPVTTKEKSEPAYSFTLPSGTVHGATANSGKVFFAPSAGICWVDADPNLALKADRVKVRHIDLGKEGETPRRTGAFTDHGHHVLFTTGKESPALAVLNAKPAEPKLALVPLANTKGTRAATPQAVTSADKKAYAFVFHNRVKDSNADETLEVVALDPNGDGDYADAKSVKTLKVGAGAAKGQPGRHDIAFDANRHYAFFTNPGDGTVSALSLQTLEVIATFTVGGTPTALVARGGEDHDD